MKSTPIVTLKKTPVIQPSCLPPRLPILLTVVVWLVMDRLDAAPVWRGVTYTVLVILWAVAIYSVFWGVRHVDVLANEREQPL